MKGIREMFFAAIYAVIVTLLTDLAVKEAAVTLIIALLEIMIGAVLLFQKLHRQAALGILIGAFQFFGFIAFGLASVPISAGLFVLFSGRLSRPVFIYAASLSLIVWGLLWLDIISNSVLRSGQFILNFG